MIEGADWQEANSQYLSVSLSWLRSRLEDFANHAHPDPSPRKPSGRLRAAAELPEESGYVADEVTALEARMDPLPALALLSRQFDLSRFEQNVLLLCAGTELDTRIASLCARAQDDPNRPYPTFALAMCLFDWPAWDVLSPERPLRFWRMIEIASAGGQPMTTSALRIDERILNYLKGLNHLDERLMPLVVPLAALDDHELPPTQQALVDEIRAQLRQPAGSMMPVVQLLGPDVATKEALAGRAAAVFGRRVYRMAAESVPSQTFELETLIRLWQRESALLPLALYLDAQEYEGPREGNSQSPLRRFLFRTDGLVFLGSYEFWPRLGRPCIAVDVAKPTAVEQQVAWAAAIGGDPGDSPTRLAGQFNLNLPAIHEIVGTVRRASTGRQEFFERLWDACRANVRPRLDLLAQRLDVKATWHNIVLPAAETELLRQIAVQVGSRGKVYGEWGFSKRMNRGFGISALFAGDSGTGKTMAAEVIANDLRLSLYRIDLSAVVSKYIGETEKNLRRLFDAADDGGAILLFDEADALFGKRSEVKDSHDRYANIEVNYLLQRMECFRGLSILATNMKSALDTAFVRRLRFVVNFSFPGIGERKSIWQRVFPPETPLDILDFDRLARLNLTGGIIHNAALNAAFLAAHAGSRVSMPLVLSAARAEFLKLDRAINEAEFRWSAGGEAEVAG